MKLLRAVIAVVVGVALARFVSVPPSTLELVIALSSATGLVALAMIVRKQVRTTVLILFVIVGLIRAVLATDSSTEVTWNEIPRSEERVELTGTVLTAPARSNDRVRLRLSVEPSSPTSASYFVDVYTGRLHDSRLDAHRNSDDFRYGDVYRFAGRFILTPSRDDIAGIVSSSSVELIDSGRGSLVRNLTGGIRAEISQVLVSSLGTKTGGLAAALLVGDRTKLHPQTVTDFRTAGLSHVLAISGLHIAMIGGIVMAASVWIIGRQRQFYLVAPGLMVWFYAALAGFTPSVTRAAIMFSVYLLARLLGRQRSILPPLALAAAIMVIIDPAILGSISFQLSFGAVLGIALFSSRIAERVSGGLIDSNNIPEPFQRPLVGIVYGMSVSLAATIATAPLVAFHFGEIPLWGIPSTLLVVPMLPLFIGGSVLLVGLDVLGAGTVTFVNLPAQATGSYLSLVAGAFSGLPAEPIGANGWSAPLIAAWYGFLIFLLNRRSAIDWISKFPNMMTRSVATENLKPSSTKHGGLRHAYVVGAIWLVAVSMLVGFVVSKPESKTMTVTFFETSRGDMIYVETPSGSRLLVDGGDDPDLAVANLESALPPLDRRIDVILSTHPDADHLGGLQKVSERFDVKHIVDSDVPHSSNIYESWDQLINDDDRVINAQPGMIIALDEDVRLEILQTSCVVAECTNFNDESVVALLQYDDVSFLLTGDITAGAESDLLLTNTPVKSTVLKVGHHGSRTSTTQGFLDAVDPALAVVTTGIKNQFGHPHEDVVQRLTNHLSPETVLVTRDQGTIAVTTDGNRLWATTTR